MLFTLLPSLTGHPVSQSTCPSVKVRAAEVTPFTLAQKASLTRQTINDCHRTVTAFIVKGMLPFSTVEAPWFR